METNNKRTPSHGGKSRKRKTNPAMWKQNNRKRLRQSGKPYTNTKGHAVANREIKTRKDCGNSCRFKCSQTFSENDRKCLFKDLWDMIQHEKQHFFSRTTERCTKKRCRTEKGKDLRKQFSYSYFFFLNDERYRVCKEFYLTTLDISGRRVSYYHETKKVETGTPSESKWGKHTKKKLAEVSRQSVSDHISSIPVVESHYCRKSTTKQYFESSLNLTKLYELYLSYCESKEVTPVKKHIYRDIFNHQFNIEFQRPKKDLCDTCYEYRHLLNPSEEKTVSFNKHTTSKNETKRQRDEDRKTQLPGTAIVCIDLENVISLPKSNVGNFYYKRKLSQYNLTGHCSLNKKGYCVLWHEAMSGRGGNDIASAVTCMLEKILADFPNIDRFVLWFDSCVPQNRNSFMSVCLREFLIKHPNIKIIEQKFCEPGHSSIQEVDNIHSQIDRSLFPAEIFSPLGLLRALKNVNRRNSFVVIQMQQAKVKNFSQVASLMNYKSVPYFSVKCLLYRADHHNHVFYKETFQGSYNEARLIKKHQIRGKQPTTEIAIPFAKISTKDYALSKEKKKDIESMFAYMPAIDVAFYKTVMK